MLAPQSLDEIEPVVSVLRGMDHLLSIIWEPKGKKISTGSYSVLGVASPPVYEGRWQVIRYDTANNHETRTHNGRQYCVICTVTQPERVDGILCLTAKGEYAPIGPWLIEVMQAADAANVRMATELRKKLWAQDDALETAGDCDEDAMFREALDKTHFSANYAGGVGNWQGKGMDFTTKE